MDPKTWDRDSSAVICRDSVWALLSYPDYGHNREISGHAKVLIDMWCWWQDTDQRSEVGKSWILLKSLYYYNNKVLGWKQRSPHRQQWVKRHKGHKRGRLTQTGKHFLTTLDPYSVWFLVLCSSVINCKTNWNNWGTTYWYLSIICVYWCIYISQYSIFIMSVRSICCVPLLLILDGSWLFNLLMGLCYNLLWSF